MNIYFFTFCTVGFYLFSNNKEDEVCVYSWIVLSISLNLSNAKCKTRRLNPALAESKTIQMKAVDEHILMVTFVFFSEEI